MCTLLLTVRVDEHARIQRLQQRRAERIGVLVRKQKLESVVSVPPRGMRTNTYDVIS